MEPVSRRSLNGCDLRSSDLLRIIDDRHVPEPSPHHVGRSILQLSMMTLLILIGLVCERMPSSSAQFASTPTASNIAPNPHPTTKYNARPAASAYSAAGEDITRGFGTETRSSNAMAKAVCKYKPTNIMSGGC